MNIIGPAISRDVECDGVLRSLPAWFGIEEARMRFARDTIVLPTFATLEGESLTGFLTLKQHFEPAWEIHCMAIHADVRNTGCGTLLLRHAEAWLLARGARLLQVKTVAPSGGAAEYEATRQFYARRGFVPVEVFPKLWSERDPALQCIKVLHAG